MGTKTSKILSVVYFLCVISCILLSAYLISDVWGRYDTRVEGSAGARVAKWEVQVTDAGQTLIFNEGGTQVEAQALTYAFTVTNHSEVAMQYTVTVTFDKAPPANASLTLGDDTVICDGATTAYTFATVYDHGTGAPPKEHALKIEVNYVSDEGKLISAAYDGVATISISAEQKN